MDGRIAHRDVFFNHCEQCEHVVKVFVERGDAQDLAAKRICQFIYFAWRRIALQGYLSSHEGAQRLGQWFFPDFLV